MKKSNVSYTTTVVCVAAVLLLATVVSGEQEAVSDQGVVCNPTLLSPCLPALTSPVPPSLVCCANLRFQRPCLCRYLRDPNYRRYIDSPNARRVSAICGVPYPRC